MPRSFQLNNRWRIALLGFILMAPFIVEDRHADAQKRRPQQSGGAQTIQGAQELQKKNLTRLTASETAEGSSITIFSDLPLNDYSAYRGGDRFYVLIPAADASRIMTGMRGRGFADVRTQKRGNDVLLSFRLLAGSAARVSQKFNRLEILITVPALVAVNSTNANANTGTPTDQSTGAGNANIARSGSRSSTGRSNRGSRYSNPSWSYSEGTTSSPDDTTTQQDPNSPSDGIPVGPNDSVSQQGTTENPAMTGPSPIVSPSVAPSVDQVAQMQPTSGVPNSTTEAPLTTTTSVPSSDSSFGAQVKQNWLFILLAVVVAGLIGWVVFARSRMERNVDERSLESIRDLRSESKIIVPPVRVKATPKVERTPSEAEIPSSVAEELAVPAIVAAIASEESSVEPKAEVIDEQEVEPGARPVAAEQASADVASLLAGDSYDEASIATDHPEARQMVAAELLAALSGRNIVRQARAREAFIKHGYFDDATRRLRTSESSVERASAARSLGLVRDEAGTPHLIAALEDSSSDVRRAAVESLAEVRDPSAVAALEALRDREKARKVPKALIQHAIEASVIGRAKDEPVLPPEKDYESSSIQVEPEREVAVHLPPIEEIRPSSEASVAQVVDEFEPPIQIEAPSEDVLEAQDTLADEPHPFLAETEILDHSTEALPYDDVALDISDVLEEPIPSEKAAEIVADHAANDWVDFDVSQPSEPSTASPLVAPQEPSAVDTLEEIEDVHLGDSSAIAQTVDLEELDLEDAYLEAPAVEASRDVVEPTEYSDSAESVLVSESEPDDSQLLPFAASETAIVESTLSEDAGSFDVAGSAPIEVDVPEGERGVVSAALLGRLASEDDGERARAVEELGRIGGEDSFREVNASFDDPSEEVRNAAARALFNLNPDRAGSFTRALREAPPERRRLIGAALSSSGLATSAIGHLMGESREKTYDAFSLLFLMAKAGEVQPLMRAVEEHPNNEVRLAVVKLLALSGQQEILPAFRRLAVRGSLPTEVRSAVMEAIYQISSQAPGASS